MPKPVSLREQRSGIGAGAGERPPERSPSLLRSRGAPSSAACLGPRFPRSAPAQSAPSPGFTPGDLQAPLGPLRSSRPASPGSPQPPSATGTPSPGGAPVSRLHPRVPAPLWITAAVPESHHRNQHTHWERGLAGTGVPESSCKALGGDGQSEDGETRAGLGCIPTRQERGGTGWSERAVQSRTWDFHPFSASKHATKASRLCFQLCHRCQCAT